MSVLRIACPACQGLVEVNERLVGKRIRCPSCGGVVDVGTPLVSADAWFIQRPQARVGPYAWSQIQQMVRLGVLSEEDHIKRDMDPLWRPLKQVRDGGVPGFSPTTEDASRPLGNGDGLQAALRAGQNQDQAPRPVAPGTPVPLAHPVRTTPTSRAEPAVWVVEPAAQDDGAENEVTDTLVKYFPSGQYPGDESGTHAPFAQSAASSSTLERSADLGPFTPVTAFFTGLALVFVASFVVIVVLIVLTRR